MKKRKLIAAALISLLTFGSAQTALAEVIYHDINDTNDSYIIDGAYVIGTDDDEDDDEHIFFTSGENKTLNYSIIVNKGVITKIVLQGVNIETTDKSGISIGSGADVVLELVGENSITVHSDDYYDEAGINVADGTLTITGKNSDSLNVAFEDNNNFNDAAAIGSNEDKDFKGTINIEGGKITAASQFGAGIGSGDYGEMSGTITISGGEVNASSEYGAGIGSGYGGEMSGTGTITISDGEVNASSKDGAGIGSGELGDMSGNISISGGEVNATSIYDAGIGSGAEGNMSGSITISGGEVNASSDYYGAGIGSGAGFNPGIAPEMSGTITISGGEVTASSKGDGAGIGSAMDGNMSGKINISGSNVNASSGSEGAGIGTGKNGNIDENGSITIGGDATVTASSEVGSGIGSGDSGNMNGNITITDNADVDITLGDKSNETGIGAGNKFDGTINILEHANVELKYDDTDYNGTPAIGSSNLDSNGKTTLSTGAKINEIPASDIDKLKDEGILKNCGEITIVDPTPEKPEEPEEPEEPEVKPDSRSTYSLKQLYIVQRINKADDGDVVTVSEKQLSKGKLPAYVLEALAKKENVTLAILCEEFDILIPSEDAVADAGDTRLYTIDELVKMYE